MSKDEKFDTILSVLVIAFLTLKILVYEVIFPYWTLAKAKKHDFKTACIYVVDKEKLKYGFQYIIRMDEKEYRQYDITAGSLFGIQQAKFNQFPINQKHQAFFEINHSQCKPVLYIEMYDFLGFKEFYLYDFIDK